MTTHLRFQGTPDGPMPIEAGEEVSSHSVNKTNTTIVRQRLALRTATRLSSNGGSAQSAHLRLHPLAAPALDQPAPESKAGDRRRQSNEDASPSQQPPIRRVNAAGEETVGQTDSDRSRRVDPRRPISEGAAIIDGANPEMRPSGKRASPKKPRTSAESARQPGSAGKVKTSAPFVIQDGDIRHDLGRENADTDDPAFHFGEASSRRRRLRMIRTIGLGTAMALLVAVAGISAFSNVFSGRPHGLPAVAQPASKIDDGRRMTQYPVPSPSSQAIIERLKAKGNSVSYMGSLDGIDSFLVSHENMPPQPAYITPNGGAVIFGLAYDAKGNDLTARQLAFIIGSGRMPQGAGNEPVAKSSTTGAPAPYRQPLISSAGHETPGQAASAPQMAGIQLTTPPVPVRGDVSQQSGETKAGDPVNIADATLVEKTNYLPFGQRGAKVLYLIADANCPYCHELWGELWPMVEAGKLQLRVIIIGKVAPSSMGKAVAVALSGDPQKAWRNAIDGSLPPVDLIPMSGSGDVNTTLDHLVKEAAQAGKPLTMPQKGNLKTLLSAESTILVNHEAMDKLHLVNTPVLFWRDATGVMRRFVTKPSADVLSQIIGAAQPISD